MLMAGVTFLSENPSLIVVVTVFALIFLLIGFGAVHLLAKLRLLGQRLAQVSAMAAEINEKSVRLHLVLEALVERLGKIEIVQTETRALMDQSRAELASLVRAVGSENQLSKAIEMARSGATA
ncbi:MAG: hypothetical protein VW828_05495, partial [Candidatus Puniceispirillum sp.]